MMDKIKKTRSKQSKFRINAEHVKKQNKNRVV